MSIITEPGAYLDIANEDYHRDPDLLPEPSLSSSGAKHILSASPYHFWFDSPLNPDRPPEDDKPHFSIGKAAHDKVLLAERWPEHYHVLPDGFSRAAKKKWADAIEEADAAAKAGLTVLRAQDAEVVDRVVASLMAKPDAMAALTNGVTEETLVWKDEETGVWLRARPDFRPNSITNGGAIRVVSDLKFVAPTHASPEGFARAIANFGYHQSAAFYFDGIEAVHGVAPTHWLHIPVEREAPYSVSLYALPDEDIERGRVLNRKAIRLFADCLMANRWPGYADEPVEVGLPSWTRHKIDEIASTSLAPTDADASNEGGQDGQSTEE